MSLENFWSFCFLLSVPFVAAQQPDFLTCLEDDEFSVFNSFTVNFAESLEVCATREGTPARISSLAEFRFVEQLVQDRSLSDFWIGVDARQTGGNGDPLNFRYTDGTEVGLDFVHVEPGTLPWAPDAPNNLLGEEACVE